MQTINYKDIIVLESRVRKVFNEVDIILLMKSIADKGLLQAPVLQADGKTLLAGERRLRAIQELFSVDQCLTYNGEKLPFGEVPYVTVGDLGYIKLREAEVEENTARVDLSWQEKAAVVSELHNFRAEEAELRGEIQTKTKTAEEIYGEGGGMKIGDVSQDVLVAEHMGDEDVAKAKDRKEALKIIERKLRAAHRERLAEKYKEEKQSEIHTIIHGDCLTEMLKLPDEEFDLIVTDPPYGIGADKFKNQSAVKHAYADDATTADTIMQAIAVEGFRVTKKLAHLYLFHDIRRFDYVKAMFEEAGWYVWPWPMIWYRGATNGILPRPKHGPRRTYESILYCIKGDKPIQAIAPDVLDIPHERGVERGAHKPVDTYESLINRSCLPGSKVLDPCAGTGPIIFAAKKANVMATAIEIDKAAVGQIMERLEALDEGKPDPLASFAKDTDDAE